MQPQPSGGSVLRFLTPSRSCTQCPALGPISHIWFKVLLRQTLFQIVRKILTRVKNHKEEHVAHLDLVIKLLLEQLPDLIH